MLVTEKEVLIKGNTALKPQHTEEIIIKKEKQSNEAELRRRKLQNQLKVKEKATVLLTILFTFLLGFSVVFGYSRIYLLQQRYNNSYNSLLQLQKDNENLKIQLVKFEDEQFIKDKAVNTLHMVKPNIEASVKVDLSKNNFKPLENKTDEGEKSLVSSLIDLFF